MKIFSRTLLVLYFGITVLLLVVGAVIEFVKDYYPIAKVAVVAFVQRSYKLYKQRQSAKPYGGLSVG